MQAWQIEECAALETLFSPPIDALLRPWESPGELLLALADKIAGSKGEYGCAEEPVLTAPEKAAVTREIGAALTGALNAYFKARVPRAEAQRFVANWLRLEAAAAAWRAAAQGAWADDATLDPTTPLMAPHFHGQSRLALLVLGLAGGDSTAGADIRLLSARKLVAHIDGGGKMEIRQTLEAAGADVFLDAATVRGLLPELETKDEDRCTFSGVVALSYAWVSPADPDPQRAQLQALRPVLVWWMCERARRKTVNYGHGTDATMQTADFGVFIDFMSMFQPDDTTGAKPAYTKPAEQASFGRALRNIGLLYGHAGTVVFKMTNTPLPPGGDADRVYHRRGWCHLERRLGDLEAPASNSLDVSAWPAAEAERAAREHGPPKLRESEEELAAQGDHVESEYPGTLGTLIRGGRGAPVSPADFEEELKEKVFSFDADRTVCAGLYRGVAEPLLAAVEELAFELLAWTAADWRHLIGTLACCPKLRKLVLLSMGADDAAMAALCGALSGGAAPALDGLYLAGNKIGDEGMRHLEKALRRDAAPALNELDLNSNLIGDEGLRHLADALARGAAPALKELWLGENEIGDEGARHLGDALARGAAPALERLGLNRNKIGDEGVRHLADALARGAVPALETLNLDRNPASAAAQQAVKDALKNRK